MCDSGCSALGCAESFKHQPRLLPCVSLPGITTRPLTVCIPCVHPNVFFFFSPSLHEGKTQRAFVCSFIHSTNRVWRVLPPYPASNPFPPTFPSFVRLWKELTESRSVMLSCLCSGSVSHSSFCKTCLLGNPLTPKPSS